MTASSLPPDLFDRTTIVSLLATVAIVLAAVSVSRRVLDPSTSTTLRVLFVWHFADALTHFLLEGSFLYHCFFSALPVAGLPDASAYYPDPHNFLGTAGLVHGSQAGGNNPLAQLWMVYARADRRWGGIDLSVVSLELLTVFFDGPLALLVCYDLARKNPRANVAMLVLATAELYGGMCGACATCCLVLTECPGFMTFCPEWLVGNVNLDGSNFMYLWVYLVFFNGLWVAFPLYAMYVASLDIWDAFQVRAASLRGTKTK